MVCVSKEEQRRAILLGLDEHVELVEVLDELGLFGLGCLVLHEEIVHLLGLLCPDCIPQAHECFLQKSSHKSNDEDGEGGSKRENLFEASLLLIGHGVMRSDVAHDRLRHVMNQSHLDTPKYKIR